jgi:hypothetical protein
MPGRRSFLIGCGCIVAAPAFAEIGLPLPLATGDLPPSLPADALAQAGMASPTTPVDIVLRIEGWESPLDSQSPADGRARIRINSSWRVAWR